MSPRKPATNHINLTFDLTWDEWACLWWLLNDPEIPDSSNMGQMAYELRTQILNQLPEVADAE